MKIGLKLRPRERRLALVAAVAILCSTVVAGFIQPLWADVREARLRAEAHRERLEAIGRLMVEAPAIRARYRGATRYLRPQEQEGARSLFLNELEAISRIAGVQLNLKPRPVRREERFERFEVELDAEGGQAAVLSFLDALFRVERLMRIERVRISAIPGREGALRANVVVQQLSLSE